MFNASLEQPIVKTGFVNDPTAADQGAGPGDSPWVFTGSAGIAASGGRMGPLTIPPAPDGRQSGFVDQGGNFSQMLNFPTAGQYTLTFQEAGIGIYGVLLDDTVIVGSHLAPDTFSPVAVPFSVTGGPHTLTFQDTDPRQSAGPLPAFIDAVAVVPEPGLAALCAVVTMLMGRARAGQRPAQRNTR
ncbi:MAG: hypothetical protein ACHRHE_04555 [Tepidisphaerales bacterium]